MKVEMVVGDVKVEVGLDKLVLAMPYPKKLKADISNPITAIQIAQYESEKAEFVSAMHYIKNMVVDNFKCHPKITKNKDLKRYSVFFDEGGLMCTFLLGFCYGTCVINLEVNPSKMNPKQWKEFISTIDGFFNLGYKELYTKAVVSHAEFFIDVPDEDLSGLVLIDNSRRNTSTYKTTTYQGKRGSPLVATMYDKAEQQKIEGNLVRVEARINRNDIRFQDLVENDLFNPLSNSLVVNVTKLKSIAQEFNKSQFVNHIKEFGLSSSGINKYTRKKMLARLKENTTSWWQPELFWATHREMLMKFRPNHVGGIA